MSGEREREKSFIVKPQQIKNRKFANLFWRQNVQTLQSHSHHIFLSPFQNLYKNILELLFHSRGDGGRTTWW